MDDLLQIKDLTLVFHTYGGDVQAVRGVELVIRKGETVGLVGESGCGKSQTAMATLKLTPIPPGEFVKGEVRYFRRVPGDPQRRAWVDLLKLTEKELRRVRGNDISM